MSENKVTPNDQEKHVKQLKRDLEGWREVLIPLNSILLWEKNAYPLILVGTTTVIFLVFWYLGPSLLTTLSVLGLMATLVDHLVPTLTATICHPENWTGSKERKLEEICRNLSTCQLQLTRYVSNFFNMRITRPKVYYTIVVLSLLVFAWIGSTVDNLLLTYLTVTIMLLLPGMKRQGLLKRYFSQITAAVTGATQGLKEKKK